MSKRKKIEREKELKELNHLSTKQLILKRLTLQMKSLQHNYRGILKKDFQIFL